MWSLFAAVAVVAIFAAAFLSMARKTTVLEIEPSNVRIGPALSKFIETVNSVNDTKDPSYIETLEQLRSSKEDVIQEASRILAQESEASFSIRHSTLLALTALREPSALDLLSRIALNPQPLAPVDRPSRRVSLEIHTAGAIEAGTILALDALEGIELLADDGHEEALQALVKAAAVNSNAVRAVALTALGAKPDRQDQLKQAKAALPREFGALAQFRRASISEVPQVDDPREYLAGKEQGGPRPPEDTRQSRRPGSSIPAEHGAPTIQGR